MEAKLEPADGQEIADAKVEAKDVLMEPGVSDEHVALFLEGKAILNPNPDNFKEVCLKVGKALLYKYGGPWQYLEATVPDPEKFAETLLQAWPKVTNLPYAKAVPDSCEETFYIHLSDLSWDPKSSTRPPPYLSSTLRMLDRYLVDTFLTGDSEGPLRLWDGPSPSGNHSHGWCCYLKGACRSATLLFLAALCQQAKWDLQFLHPSLYVSMQSILCKRGTLLRDLKSIAIENAQIAARGDLRKAHDSLTWLGKLLLLQKNGYASDQVLSSWNAACSQETKIQGQKLQSLNFLMTLTPDTLSILLQHGSKYGNKTAFMEDCWANKKIQIGSSPRCPQKEWSDRLRITEPGVKLAIDAICRAYDAKSPETRMRLSKPAMEEVVYQAQLVVSIQQTLVEDMGVPLELATGIQESFLIGDVSLKLELESAISEKPKNFNIATLTSVTEILRKHRGKTEAQLAVGISSRNIAAANLEKEEFQLVIQQMEHDIRSYELWRVKVEDREAAVFHSRLQQKVARQKAAKQMASKLLETGSEHWRMSLSLLKKPEECWQVVQSTLSILNKIHQRGSENEILMLCFTNWSAPTVLSAEGQRRQASVMSSLVNRPGSSTLGVLLTPSHSTKRGLLWKEEELARGLLSQSNCNLDTHFVLGFQERHDSRDTRSMVQPGRFVLPMGDKEFHQTYSIFKHIPLMKKGCVNALPLPPAEELQIIEDCSDTAMPSFTGDTYKPSKGERVFQLGSEASSMFLDSCLKDIGGAAASKPLVLLVDLTTHCGDLAKAFWQQTFGEKGKTHHLYYLGFCETELEVDWVQEHVKDMLAHKFLENNYAPPVPLPAESPDDSEHAMPPQPTLSILAWNSKVKSSSGLNTLKTPDRLLQTWHDHSSWGAQFQEFLAKMRKDYALDIPGSSTSENTKKRIATETDPKSHSKQARTTGPDAYDPPPEFMLQALPEGCPLTHSIPIASSKHVELSLAVGHRIFLKNTSSEVQMLRKGMTLCGFYKGKWVDNGSPEKAVLFQLEGVFNNQFMPLNDVIKGKRATSPADAHVGFHNLKDLPREGNPAHFVLEKKHDVWFQCEDVAVKTEGQEGKIKVASHNCAGLIPPQSWNTWATSLIWSVRWPPTASKGLQPVRPYVAMTRAVSLPPQAIIELKAAKIEKIEKIEKKEQ